MADRNPDAPSDAAQRIEDKLVEETGKASGDPDKPVQRKWDEMGEKPEIKGDVNEGGSRVAGVPGP
ncbi:hypothetical protein [Azospirillum doebereinerae]